LVRASVPPRLFNKVVDPLESVFVTEYYNYSTSPVILGIIGAKLKSGRRFDMRFFTDPGSGYDMKMHERMAMGDGLALEIKNMETGMSIYGLTRASDGEEMREQARRANYDILWIPRHERDFTLAKNALSLYLIR